MPLPNLNVEYVNINQLSKKLIECIQILFIFGIYCHNFATIEINFSYSECLNLFFIFLWTHCKQNNISQCLLCFYIKLYTLFDNIFPLGYLFSMVFTQANSFFGNNSILKWLFCGQYYLKQIITKHITGSVIDNKTI